MSDQVDEHYDTTVRDVATDLRLIEHTREPVRHPWPADCFIQGGRAGIVFAPDGTSYRTAFVEAFPGTFLRGEGATLIEAEDACWAKYQILAACPAAPGHGPFEAREYRNGSGYCTACGGWFSRVLPELPSDPGSRPSFMERVLTGDEDALAKVFEALGGVDQS